MNKTDDQINNEKNLAGNVKAFKKQDFKKVAENLEEKSEKNDGKGEVVHSLEEKIMEDEENFKLANEILASQENLPEKEEIKNKINPASEAEAEWNI